MGAPPQTARRAPATAALIVIALVPGLAFGSFLNDDAAVKLGPPLFEEAAKAILAVSPQAETALELMKHRLQVVRRGVQRV